MLIVCGGTYIGVNRHNLCPSEVEIHFLGDTMQIGHKTDIKSETIASQIK